jgi:CheY-like chemotaxis protein
MNTILIVDDEYLIADILGFALEDEGYLVEKASNGCKALEALKEKRAAGDHRLHDAAAQR